MEGLLAFLRSPIMAKLCIELAGLLLVLHARKRDLENFTSLLLGVVGLLCARDLLFHFFPYVELCLVSDLLVVVGLAFSFSWFGGKRLGAIILAAVNLALLVVFSLNLGLGFIPDYPFGFNLILLGLDGLCLVVLMGPRGKSGDSLWVLVGSRVWLPLAIGIAAYALALGFIGYQSPIAQCLLIPLAYLAIPLLALSYMGQSDAQSQRDRDYLTTTIDSIYAFMESSGNAFKNSADLNELLMYITTSLVKETKADSGLIAMMDEFDDILTVKAVQGSFPPPFKLPQELSRKQARIDAYIKHAQFKVGETVLGESLKTGTPIFVDDPSRDGRFYVNDEEDFLRYSSMMIVPFIMGDRSIGVAALARSGTSPAFSEMEYERCKMLADFGTIVIRNLQSAMEASEKSNIEKEADIAQDIQRGFLPKKLVDVGRASFAAFCQSAHGVNSDYYDLISTRNGKAYIVMADIAGKGVQASVIMVMVRTLLHLVTNTDRDIATVMSWINRGITGKVEMDHFATLALVELDCESGALRYVNAGHRPPLVYRLQEKSMESVEVESVPIGVERKTEYRVSELALGAGDVLVLYTDGLVEAMNVQGKQYGEKRLREVIIGNGSQNPKDMVLSVKKDIQEFIGQARQHDDQSLLIVQIQD